MRIVFWVVLITGCGSNEPSVTTTFEHDTYDSDIHDSGTDPAPLSGSARDLEGLFQPSDDTGLVEIEADGSTPTDAAVVLTDSGRDASPPQPLQDAGVSPETTAYERCDQEAPHCRSEELCIQISGATYCSPQHCKTDPARECPILFEAQTVCSYIGCIIPCETTEDCPVDMDCHVLLDNPLGAAPRCLFNN